MQRLDLISGLEAKMHTWYWEATDKIYKKLQFFYKDIVELGNLKEDTKGGFWKGTSAIGAAELLPRLANGQIQEDTPIDGFPVYASVKDKGIAMEVPYEQSRDWWRVEDFIKDYISKNAPSAIETTIDKIVADIFNYGGYTAGHEATFNQNSARINLTTYASPNLCYDGKPFFTREGNERTAKNGSTYFNAFAEVEVNAATARKMRNRLIGKNNKKENGQPFDNSQDLIIVCHPLLADDWEQVNNSTLNPDDALHATNPLKGAFKKIIPNQYFTNETFSAMGRKNTGIKAWFGEPKFKYWEIPNPPAKWVSIMIDYAICVQNFRTWVGNNAPISA